MKKLVTDPTLCKIIDRTPVTLWRWRKAGILPWPKKLRGQNYSDLDEVYASLDRAFEAEKEEGDAAA